MYVDLFLGGILKVFGCVLGLFWKYLGMFPGGKNKGKQLKKTIDKLTSFFIFLRMPLGVLLFILFFSRRERPVRPIHPFMLSVVFP